MGVAIPFQLWNWVSIIGAPQAEMDAWRHRDIGAELAALTGIPVYVQNDATSACGAELVFGTAVARASGRRISSISTSAPSSAAGW